jgi:hypothetical protein
MRSAHWMAAAVLALGATGSAWAVGDGLLPSDAGLWPRWQGRLALGTYSPATRPDAMNVDSQGLKVGGASLLGDYYFTRTLRGVGSASGFRATSGVFLGSHATSLLSGMPSASVSGRAFNVNRRNVGVWGLTPTPADSNTDPVPYVGVGYTGLAGKGGWGFSADLGLMALNPGSAVKLGRVFSGQSLDDALRDMRLSPLLQLGVSYSF